MTRPPLPPIPPLPPRPGRFRQTPPAMFTPIFGLIGLGLAWRQSALALGLPAGVGEAVLGAATLLWLFAAGAYLAKVARRPGVVAEDLRVLPGRAGLTAASLSVFLLAAVAVPYAPGLATGLLCLGLGLHALLALGYVRALVLAPPGQQRVTPVWHLAFVGFILAALSAVPLGHAGLATAVFWGTMPVALAIWGLSALQFARASVPPPLRPLLAIHLAPAALFATVASLLGQDALATAFAVLVIVLLLALLAGARWLTAAGFSPLWGAFTFPAAAASTALLMQDAGALRHAGALVLLGATVLIPPIAVRVMKLWAGGQLGAKTNAAIA